MPDTGAPWNLRYPDVTDLVVDGPEQFEELADDVAAGLTSIADDVPAGIGSNVVTGGASGSLTVAGATFIDIANVTVTITPTTATSKVLVICTITQVVTTRSFHAHEYRLLAAGVESFVTNTSGGNDSSNGPAGRASLAMHILHSPATTSPVIYNAQGRTISGTNMVVTHRTITAIEVAA